jgi:hypothetical protein
MLAVTAARPLLAPSGVKEGGRDVDKRDRGKAQDGDDGDEKRYERRQSIDGDREDILASSDLHATAKRLVISPGVDRRGKRREMRLRDVSGCEGNQRSTEQDPAVGPEQPGRDPPRLRRACVMRPWWLIQ